MIMIGLGANLPSVLGAPRVTLEAALTALPEAGVSVLARSAWYRSAPVPPSAQPWFVNAVALVGTDLGPEPLLELLHGVEARLGRTRTAVNEPRAIDLDLLAHGDAVLSGPRVVLPHPRLHLRAFVLLPLREVAPHWRHPVTGEDVDSLIAALPAGQTTERCLD
ncbi:MAG: 2-amino-4-hydroxy-6-hydroxymethyldihydropteridine diphosphokinase [Rhodospirillales bacterium]|nr:2-amino-4-hydroxy-6-hydroxymethyldihydropteridine diphosphokinase [Rhodospirillales bacterium]